MTDYNKSLYALNKKSEGIVYKNSDGSILEITFEKISDSNPDFTAEDFEKIKELSDELYRQETNNDCTYHHHITASYDLVEDSEWLATESFEDELIIRTDAKFYAEKIRKAIDSILTPTQKRRFLLYVINGLTFRKIAEIEGVKHNKVIKSVNEAKAKIKKNLKNF